MAPSMMSLPPRRRVSLSAQNSHSRGLGPMARRMSPGRAVSGSEGTRPALTVADRLRLSRNLQARSDQRLGNMYRPFTHRVSQPFRSHRLQFQEEYERTSSGKQVRDNSIQKSSKRNSGRDEIESYPNTEEDEIQIVETVAKPSSEPRRAKRQDKEKKSLGQKRAKSLPRPHLTPALLGLEDEPTGSEARKRKAEASSRYASPPKRRKEKENMNNNVHEISSDEEPPQPSRLKLQRGKERTREKSLQYRTVAIDEYTRQVNERNDDRKFASTERRKSTAQRPEKQKVQNRVKQSFASEPQRGKNQKRKSMFASATNPHRQLQNPQGSDDSEDSIVLNDAAVRGGGKREGGKELPSTKMGFDGGSEVEAVPVQAASPSGRRRKKKSVAVPPEGFDSSGRREARASCESERPPPRKGVQPLRNTGSVKAEPKDLNVVVVISDDEGSRANKTEDVDETLASELSQKAEISRRTESPRQGEITTQKFYGSPRGSKGERKGERRKSRRRVRRIAIPEGSDEDEEYGESEESNIRFKKLSKKENRILEILMFEVPKDTVIAKIEEARIDLKAEEFGCLRASRWLSDEIMNSFVALINVRNKEYSARSDVQERPANTFDLSPDNDADVVEVSSIETTAGLSQGEGTSLFDLPRPRAHVFNTFFFTRLSQGGYDYDGVRRWLRKAGRDVLDLDLIMFPINISNLHWILTVIDMRGKRFLYCDSTAGSDKLDAIPKLRKWLHDEVADKHGADVAAKMCIDSWTADMKPEYQPQQKDDGSCGIFTLYMAEYLERGVRPNFKQSNIRELRQRTALFLKSNSLPKT